ncbi:early endosome antigen 1 isoform X1 [Hydra vulgaris]|uniref:Early endosome antigen 1 isoform X1 n=1 Tax=Hydra vulgaris TaxID=6087 RepID=A0ABM4CBL0_HYDVU
MADRTGNCKIFAANYFNPTKCQNCFKQKDQHPTQEETNNVANNSSKPLTTKASNTGISKALVIEGNLERSCYIKGTQNLDSWKLYWFCLFSNGELQSFDSPLKKESPISIYLNDYIRMLNGKEEIGIDFAFGIKTLRDTTFFKASSKVDYVNWWKEFSTFISAPLKNSPAKQTYSKPNTSHSNPYSSLSKVSAFSSRSSSVSSLHEADSLQTDALRSKIAKLEETNSKLSNVDTERRKLQLEVNYWKEYVTNSQNARRSGQVVDANTDLADVRKQLIQVQDELNETNKRFKTQSGKLVIQNKELSNLKEKLLEAKSIAAVYKAKNEQLTAELSRKNGTVSPSEDAFGKTSQRSFDEDLKLSSTHGAQHFEEKFLVLKDKLKRIERELYLKSKELEKANESRSKVAKYTRTLLQELETRLSDAETKSADLEVKLSNAQAELALERERRLKQEDGLQKRSNSFPSNDAKSSGEHSSSEDSKYADYYRSRYKEVEASLLEKDKQLHESEQKIKEMQLSVKNNSDNYKVIADLQNKLSDATHKLSDRQLKIHELTKEIDNLRCIESTYERKAKQCETLEDIVKDLETKLSDQKKNFHVVKQELEMLRIRELVLKEQLQTVAQESDYSDDDDENDQLQKSVEMKQKIDNLIEAECLIKKLNLDKENLENKNKELESRLRKLNTENFKNIESSKFSEVKLLDDNDKEEYKNRLKELETRIFEADDKYLNKIRILKNEHQQEIDHILDKHTEEKTLFQNKIENIQQELDQYRNENKTLVIRCKELESALNETESKVFDEVKLHTNTKLLLEERSCLLQEIEERCKRVSIERDTLKMQFQRQESQDGHEFTEESHSETNRMSNKVKETTDFTDGRGRSNFAKRERIFSSDDEIFHTPKTSTSSESDTASYKIKCQQYEKELTSVTKLLVSSEQSCISVAQDLENQLKYQEDLLIKYELLECRMSEIENQISDSQETLQLKSDELEKERKNVLYLVDVTSAYIKKLETSLAESKAKVQELQNFIEISKEGKRPQPEGRSDLPDNVKEDSFNEENCSNEQLKTINQKLATKISILEKELSELRLKKDDSQVIHKNNENIEELHLEIEHLEKELQAQEVAHQKEIDILQEHFQAELKAAFSGDTGTYDMLNRIQELEICLEETRTSCNNKIKEMKQEFEQEKEQMMDDMATVLHASQNSDFHSNNETRSGTVEELEERIMKLEEQLTEQREKFEEELQLEKDAHTQDMEDTIRDMMMVRNASTRYDGSNDPDGSLSTGLHSSNELEELKLSYETKIQILNEEHEDQLDQVRRDMAIIVSSITQGRSSDTIMELQARIKEMEMDMEDMRADRIAEIEEFRLNLKRAESATFFANRRNEDMGSKIYNMQNEMEEMERKHQVIVQSYQEKLESLGVDVNVTGDAMKFHKELEEKNKQLQLALDKICKERDLEMDAFVLRLQEEKRQAIQEATDNTLRLEELIDEMKNTHEREKKEMQQSLLPERSECSVLRKRIEELELTCESLKEEYELEIEELTKEHKKEVEKLRLFYEKEIAEVKRGPSLRKTSVDHGSLTKSILKEQKEKHDKEMENLRQSFDLERRQAKIVQEREIDDIRMQYDEKLKMSYQDGMRRQSVSERKSDATKIRELISEKDNLATKLLELEIKYDKETKAYLEKIKNLNATIEELKGNNSNKKLNSDGSSKISLTLDEDEQKKLEEIQEQIRRYERRIDYYQQKSLRENSAESERVSELQSDVVNLHNEMETIKNNRRKAVYEKEKKEKPSIGKQGRRNTDSSALRRHTDTEADKYNPKKERDPRQRWSDLEERTEVITRSISELDGKRNPRLTTTVTKAEGKSGTVLARKTLWENIIEEPKPRKTTNSDVK